MASEQSGNSGGAPTASPDAQAAPAIARVTAAPAPAAAPDHYYWEEPDAPEPPVVTRVTHTLHWLFAQVLGVAEYVGEVFSDIWGMENSRYQWAVEAENNRVEQFDEEERLREQRERWALIQRHNAAVAAAAAAAPAGAAAPSVAGDAGALAASDAGAMGAGKQAGGGGAVGRADGGADEDASLRADSPGV